MKNILLTISTIILLGLNAHAAKITPVVISEVFYDTPLNEDLFNFTPSEGHHNGEFIELYNPTAEEVDISGWSVGDNGSRFTFPLNTIISSKEVVLVAFKCPETNFSLSTLFPAISGSTKIFYQHGIWLRNEGEKISLYDKRGNLVDEMSYRYAKEAGYAFSKKVISTYWDLRAHNGTSMQNMVSIQRRLVQWTSSSILSLKNNYFIGAPTPGTAYSGLLTQTVENALYSGSEINTNLAVGTLPGAAAVSPAGAASYQIPIEVPVGTNGVQPQLSIAYNSQGGYGALGIGWDITGVSAISRGMQSFYFDETSEGKIDATTIKFNETDQLYIDGQRLILVDGTTHFQEGAVYSTETENYARVRILKSPETQIIYFELTTKEGTVTEYGKTANSLLKSGSKVLAWKISKVTDVNNNAINYTYQDNGQYLKTVSYGTNRISFDYDDKHIQLGGTTQQRCINGFWIQQNKLLSEIQVFVDEVLGRGYQFVYNSSENYAKLDAVKPYFGSNKAFINSTKIGWGKESSLREIRLDKMQDGNLNNTSRTHLYTGDIDGDGYPDRIEMWEGSEGSNEKGYVAVTLKGNTTLPLVRFPATNKSREFFRNNLVIGDVNNDGKDEIMLILTQKMLQRTGSDSSQEEMGGVVVLGINDSKTELVKIADFPNYHCDGYSENCRRQGPEWTYGQEYGYYPLLCNINGDEYLDLVIIPYRNDTKEDDSDSEQQRYFVEVYYGGSGGLTQQGSYEKNYYLNGKANVTGDFNANGVVDFKRIGMSWKFMRMNVADKLLLSVEDHREIFNWIDNKLLFEELYPADINNDGLTDILVRQGKKGKKKWFLLKNTNGSLALCQKETLNLHNFWKGNGGELENDYAVLIDYNGDGYTDIIIADDYYSGKNRDDYQKSHWRFYRNTGGSFVQESFTYTEYPHKEKDKAGEDGRICEGISRMNPVVMDINNDGVPDLVFGDRQGNRDNRYYKAFTMPGANKRNVVHSITNGMGQTESFSYKYFSAYNHTENRADLRDLKAPMMVVDQYTAADGSITSYDYEKPKVHTRGKGFLGFEKVKTTNDRTKQTNVTEYEINTDYYTVNPKKQIVSINGVLISESTQTNDVLSAEIVQGKNGEKRFIPIVTRQVTTDKIKNTVTTTEYSFNSNGTLAKTKSESAEFTSISEFNNYVKRKLTGLVAYLPQTKKVTSKRIDHPNYVFTSTYTYDEKGNVETSVDMQGTYAETSSVYEYFPAGKLKSVTITPLGQTSRITRYTYDDKFRFAESKENVLEQKSFTTHDDWGRVLSEKGIDGLTTYYKYNAFGQLIKKTLPTGEEISYNTQWGVSSLYKQTISSNKTNVVTETRYDALGREIYTETSGWKGAKLKSFTEYDFVTGKLIRAVKPRYDGETEVYTDYEYNDPFQRVSREITFDGTNTLITKYDYADAAGKVTVTAPDGTISYSITNAMGEVTRRHDQGGDILYTYNALGKPVKIETNGSVTEIKYDEVGRQKELHDPNAGVITYEYFADGSLKKQVNANGDITELEYDIAGRTKIKTLTDKESGITIGTSSTEYVYVPTGNGIGQIQNIIKKENGTTVHTQSFTYNNRHLNETITDEYDGKTFVFSNTYDPLWRPLTSTSPSGLIITNEYDNFGALVKVKKGEKVIWEGTTLNSNGQFTGYKLGNGIETVNIFNNRGELTDIQAKKESTFIQHNHYEYEAQTGNLLSRNDLIYGRSENFRYDELDRLTHAYLNTNLQYEMDYHSNGNIKTKTDVGTYLYNSPRPHAMSGISGAQQGISNNKQFIEYTAFNKISRVAQGVDENNIADQYLISYGLDEQRIKTRYYSNGSLQKTRYYLGSYEEEISADGTITKIDYIYTPVGLTAMQQNNTLYYVHTDRQGSLERITNTSGTIVTAYAYTPWGGRILLSGVNITDRGYTGHEHLVALNLINMNGRVYDPVLARFLSPDPYVQAPDFTQSFNRYAYCLNNPFKYVDPEGELFYIIPSISWSPSGGLSVSVSAGFGIYGVASVGGTIGYNFKNDSWSFTANASLGGLYVYGGYDTKAGWIAGAGYGFGGGGGAFSFNTNLTSMGVSWSQNGGWSANLMGMQYSKTGVSFDPSVGASANFRWGGTEYYDYIADGEQLETNYENAIFKTQEEINSLMAEHNIKTKVYYRSNEEKLSSEYQRDVNTGIIKKDGKVILGTTQTTYKGLKISCTISMSPHKTYEGFVLTLNHELIHVYHRTNFDYVNYTEGEEGFKQLTEYGAYNYTQLYYRKNIIPLEFIPSESILNRNIMHLSYPKNLIPLSSDRYGRAVY